MIPQDSKTWQPFQMFEVRRLERAYRKHYKALHGRSVDTPQPPSPTASPRHFMATHPLSIPSAHVQSRPLSPLTRFLALPSLFASPRSPKWTDNPLVASEAGRRLLLVDSSTEVEGGTSSAGGSAGHSDSDGRDSTYEETSPFSPENTNTALLHHEVGPQDVFVNQGTSPQALEKHSHRGGLEK
jgi:hypothetical protein